MVGEFAEGTELPCDDTFVDEESGERRTFRSTSEGHFEGWHRSDAEVTDQDLRAFEARPDVERELRRANRVRELKRSLSR